MDGGPENIAGCQNADQMTGAVEDRNRTYLFIEHDVGDLADLHRRSGGRDPAAHYTGELVLGERSRRQAVQQGNYADAERIFLVRRSASYSWRRSMPAKESMWRRNRCICRL